MHIAIHFHDESVFVTVEVHEPVADLMLAAEFQIGQLAIAEEFPKQILYWRLLLPQFARTLHEAGEIEPAPIVSSLAPFSSWEKGWG
jgi:hypothetical protein